MFIYLSLLVAVIGALVYLLASKAEAKELGRLAYACGLLAFLIEGNREDAPDTVRESRS